MDYSALSVDTFLFLIDDDGLEKRARFIDNHSCSLAGTKRKYIVKKILGNGSSYLLDELDYRKTTARLTSG